MSEENWSSELSLLDKRGVTLAPGLTAEELQRVEARHSFRFPSDLRSFLSCAMPSSERFPNWRTPDAPALIDQLGWPFDGIAFDIKNNAFWWEPWGPRPSTLNEALAVAKKAVEVAPRLIPIYGHRYLPAEPETAGNPVFSVYQTDIIYYGTDLRRYLACEFYGIDWTEATKGEARRIRFWTDLIESRA